MRLQTFGCGVLLATGAGLAHAALMFMLPEAKLVVFLLGMGFVGLGIALIPEGEEETPKSKEEA